MKIWKLYAYFMDYDNSKDISFLIMGNHILIELTDMGQDGFTEKEIRFINSYVDACIDAGIR